MKKSLLGVSLVLSLLLPMVASAESVWFVNGSVSDSAGSSYVYSGITLKVGVWPVAPGHKVGVVYTYDRWATSHWAELTWEANVANAYGSQDELWTLNHLVTIPGEWRTPSTIDFAIYVEDASGHRTWNNNGGWNFQVVEQQ
jgi:hypothetical protein